MPPALLRLTVVRLSIAACCLVIAMPALAITVTRVEVKVTGADNERLADNVRTALSLNEAVGKDVSGRRLNYLLREAEAETREALQPFGYYSPTITIQRSDRSASEDADARDVDPDADDDVPAADNQDGNAKQLRQARRVRTLTVSIHVEPGKPVRIRGFTLGMDGEADHDASVQSALSAFVPRKGEVLNHTLYETSKGKVNRALATHGYFDADFAARRVEVTRADFAADIDLRWTSGKRFVLGEATFIQAPKTIIRDKLLHKLVNWDENQPYDEAELEQLRQSLVALDYFGLVEVLPQPEQAGDDKIVPVQVNLTPAPRSIYTTGLSYGTVSGPGVNLGVERRYLNTRGHKALGQLDYARDRKALTLQYRMPAFAWLDGWYTASAQAVDEANRYINSRRLELVASRSGQFNSRLNLVASLHVLRERWAFNVADNGGGALAVIDYRFATLAYPSLGADYIDVDNRLAPRRGFGASAVVQGGKGSGANGANFAQLYLRGQWFHGFGPDDRLIVRGEAGHTFGNDLLDLPPSLRYYAGGDRSVRGYSWHEIGPRIQINGGGNYYTGAKNVLTASVEYERYLYGPWGAAVFVDSGSAFNGRKPQMRTGVGIGLRWKSPVGPVRIDIAHGLDQPDSPITLHLNIGADL
ncbi:autotransporter assembly complex family protein [Thermomonas sp.]|uniref:autotransporter assembly complex protein TamA n=1 Tax=Thermomonas sp. TaxID=1971895 RepID=UPI002489E85A|nr:autotransporter assembly complex family protein [Thermomonas sp.]MDI1252329.1 autotransporter assembly complex protein TamA [Thermomonas sp.]